MEIIGKPQENKQKADRKKKKKKELIGKSTKAE